MSYDLEIVTNKKPIFQHLENFFSSRKGLKVEGTLNSAACKVLITKQTKADDYPYFTIDGPFSVELDDLQDEVISSVLDPRWLTQISVAAGASERDFKMAKKIAQHIADAFQGSVYDPQEDKVIW